MFGIFVRVSGFAYIILSFTTNSSSIHRHGVLIFIVYFQVAIKFISKEKVSDWTHTEVSATAVVYSDDVRLCFVFIQFA